MRKKLSRYFNIYVVIWFIGVFSILYLLSFAFILNDVAGGSSREMKKIYCTENPEECNVSIKKERTQEK
ncbi:MAG: hypothetical protein WBK95_03580 [Sulfurimonas sp.]|nr:hypothetical protein [Sulfurimonas sp.]MDD3060658.1 hypothetical protein [Sulfurimonas sp.]MDD5203328.1 hypothetical protein [Sulfurimonas sp.]